MSDFDFDGISANDETILRNLATEIEKIERVESESWLMLAPKYAKARGILKNAPGRQFGKRWNQWLALQPTGGKHRTGDKLANAHELVERWGFNDAERATIARYRSVICDLAAPTMPDEIQEEFRPRLLAGEDVTRQQVKDRYKEHRRQRDIAAGKLPADEPAPVDLPEPEEDVKALQTQIAELAAANAALMAAKDAAEQRNADLRKEISDLHASKCALEEQRASIVSGALKPIEGATLHECASALRNAIRACSDKIDVADVHLKWPDLLGLTPMATSDDATRRFKDLTALLKGDNNFDDDQAKVFDGLNRIAWGIRYNELDEEARGFWDRGSIRIVNDCERARRLLPAAHLILPAKLYERDVFRANRPFFVGTIEKPLKQYLKRECRGKFGFYWSGSEVIARFADDNDALAFKMRWF